MLEDTHHDEPRSRLRLLRCALRSQLASSLAIGSSRLRLSHLVTIR